MARVCSVLEIPDCRRVRLSWFKIESSVGTHNINIEEQEKLEALEYQKLVARKNDDSQEPEDDIDGL